MKYDTIDTFLRVVVLDDEPLALEGMLDSLHALLPNGDVTGFVTADELLLFAREHKIDVAFLDVNLGAASGVDVGQKLQEIDPAINIIFVTGYTEYSLDAMRMHASGYLLKPVTEKAILQELRDLRHTPPQATRPAVEMRAFGDFEVFIDGRQPEFSYKKTKELLALLVDRKGALCTNEFLITLLWEDEDDAKKKQSHLRNLRQDLVKTFRRYGYADLIITRKGAMAIDKDRVFCDYYEWIRGNGTGKSIFRGSYMEQYSWAEETKAALLFAEEQQILD